MARSCSARLSARGATKSVVCLYIFIYFISNVQCQNKNVTISSDSDRESSNYRIESKIAWLTDLFDHHYWDANSFTNITMECRKQVRTYVSELKRGTIWASKMSDASGRYNGNLLYGNDYLLGSINSCIELGLAEYNAIVPPFPAHFYVSKFTMSIGDGHLPQPRLMFLGMCLPGACRPKEVGAIIETTFKRAIGHEPKAERVSATFKVIQVREVPGNYSFWGDPKFYFVGLSGILTIILVIVASTYEAVIENKKSKEVKADNQNIEKAVELTLNNNSDDHIVESVNVAASLNGKHFNNNNVKTEAVVAVNKEQEINMSMATQILLCFSALSNGRKILSVDETSGDTLTCLHGIRFLSVFWVIMVHTYLAVFYVADNKTLRVVTERNFGYQTVGNASYTVDSFFFISGLLVTILYFRSCDAKQAREEEKKAQITEDKSSKNGYTNNAMSSSDMSIVSSQRDVARTLGLGEIKEPLVTKKEFMDNLREFGVLVFYRYLRLTPVYAFVIGLNELNVRLHYNESVFEPGVNDSINCGNYWWRNVLYINNWFPMGDMCMIWSWYMAVDTQFYLIGIFFLLISAKYFKFSAISMGVIMVLSWLTSMSISLSHQYKARIQEPFEMFDALYDKPWSRIGAYIVGMITGWYLHTTKCKVQIPVWVQIICWPTSILIMGSLIYGMVDGYLEIWWTAFYVSVGHTAWGVALAWLTIACCTGHGGIVNSILSYRGALPLSRLTYCAYLVHPLILMMSTYQMDGPLHLQNGMVLVIYAGNTVMSFIVSFTLSICFEAPIVRLMKVIMGRKPRPKTHASHDDE